MTKLTLSAEDLDAYLPEKATSKAFSRPRLEVKQRGLAWGRGVLERLDRDGVALEMEASDEHPTLRNQRRVQCQWVFFWRTGDARRAVETLLDQGRSVAELVQDPHPSTRHACLALCITSSRVEVGVLLHASARIDVDNLLARLGHADGSQSLVASIRALPEAFEASSRCGDASPPMGSGLGCSTATSDEIVAALRAAVSDDGPRHLWVGWTLSRQVVLDHAEVLGQNLEDAIVALGRVYQQIAWSRSNDFIDLSSRVEVARLARERNHAEASARTDRWRAQRDAEVEQSRGAGSRQAGSWQRGARAGNGSSPLGERGEPTLSRESSGVALRSDATRGAGQMSDRGIAAGVRVRVKTGPFADRVGVVSDVDSNRGARVMLGLLATRFALHDLEMVQGGRERPNFQSSHRRSGASRKAR